MEGITIRKIASYEAESAMALALEVFMEFEAPDYPPEGMETFKKDIVENTEYLEMARQGVCPIYGAFDGEELVALMGMRSSKTHINLAFTKKEYHRKGITRAIFKYLLQDVVKENPSLEALTLNSSPYGLPFYLAIGFVPQSEEQTISGIRFTPMKYIIKPEYITEPYMNCKRFNEQYQEIYRFLLKAGECAYNEHFPWGRFDWMQIHTMLEEEKLTKILLFRDVQGEIIGMATHDTFYDDRVYLLHTTSDKALLCQIVDAVLESEDGTVAIKANSKDAALIEVLREKQFEMTGRDNTLLELDLSHTLQYQLPDGYTINAESDAMDPWQYQLVIHKGFDNEGIPEPWDEEVLTREVHSPIRTFAIHGAEYCAHCGLWYTEGKTAYVEPVATVPEHRKKGLAKAAIYEACNRARSMGAKRATVLSDQEFYYRIGFTLSSEVYRWEKNKI